MVIYVLIAVFFLNMVHDVVVSNVVVVDVIGVDASDGDVLLLLLFL